MQHYEKFSVLFVAFFAAKSYPASQKTLAKKKLFFLSFEKKLETLATETSLASFDFKSLLFEYIFFVEVVFLFCTKVFEFYEFFELVSQVMLCFKDYIKTADSFQILFLEDKTK